MRFYLAKKHMPKFFDRYVFKEVIPPFLVGLLTYTFVLLMNWLLELSELLIAKGVSLGVTLKLLLYLIPAILAFTVPMAVLMGMLAGMSRMSSDSEITAFKSLGISHGRTIRPLLVYTFGGWIFASILTLYLAPHFNFKWTETLTLSVLNKVELQFNPREFNESLANMVLYIQDIDRDKSWENIFIYFTDSAEEPRIVLARKGQLHFYPEAKRAVIELFDGIQHSSVLSEPDKYYRVESSAHIEEEIKAENLFPSYTPEKRVREKNIRELFQGLGLVRAKFSILERDKKDVERRQLKKDHIQRLENSLALAQADHERRSYLVEIHKRFALPFVSWIFVFLGLPLGISTKKGGRTSGFTLSLAIILIYYVCLTMGEKTAMDGRISPFLGIWMGNILFGLFGLFLFYRSARELPILARFSHRFRFEKPSTKEKKGRRLPWPRLSLFFPNILDRYIIRKYLTIWSLIFISLVSISDILTFFERLGNIYDHHKPLSMLLTYIRFRTPEFIHYCLPVTALMATLLTLGLLTKSNEITALKACGISVYRAVLPLLLLAVLSGGLAFQIQENVLPQTNKKAEELWNKINDRPPQSYSYENRRWVVGQSGKRFYHYTYFDPKTSTFIRLSIFDFDTARWTMTRRIFAEKAVLKDRSLSLEKGWVREFSGNAQEKFEKRESMEIPLTEGKSLFLREGHEPSKMNFGELRRYIRDVKGLGFETGRYRVDLNSKISFLFVAFIMTLLGIPFAFAMGKKGALVGIGLSVALSLVYWVAIGIFRSLGYMDYLSVFFAAWGPNIIFGLIGSYLLFRLRT